MLLCSLRPLPTCRNCKNWLEPSPAKRYPWPRTVMPRIQGPREKMQMQMFWIQESEPRPPGDSETKIPPAREKQEEMAPMLRRLNQQQVSSEATVSKLLANPTVTLSINQIGLQDDRRGKWKPASKSEQGRARDLSMEFHYMCTYWPAYLRLWVMYLRNRRLYSCCAAYSWGIRSGPTFALFPRCYG